MRLESPWIRISIATRDKAWSASADEVEGAPGNDTAKMREIMQDIQHSEIPIRAYGLATLRKLVLAKDKAAEAHIDSIIIIFGSQLEDPDQFVFLRAIDGLAAIGDVRPALAMPELAAQYTKAGVDAVTRLKIGQAMLLVAQRCGETLPVHAQHFVNAFLQGCRHKEADVRASSLSNLAEMADILGHGVHPFITDMLEATGAMLALHESPEPRRAAVLLCSRLLKTLGKAGIMQHQREMQHIYRGLKVVSSQNADELTRVHAISALEDLHEIMTAFMFPKQPEATLKVSV